MEGRTDVAIRRRSKKGMRKVQFLHVPADAENDTIMVKTVGRNEPCPCGSGKKAKNCCGKYKEYYYTPKKRGYGHQEGC